MLLINKYNAQTKTCIEIKGIRNKTKTPNTDPKKIYIRLKRSYNIFERQMLIGTQNKNTENCRGNQAVW